MLKEILFDLFSSFNYFNLNVSLKYILTNKSKLTLLN